MNHFMEWLYIHYIRPVIQQSDDSEYKKYFAQLNDGLTVDQRDARDRVLEFYACNGFLLGLRTGAGLYSLQQREDIF